MTFFKTNVEIDNFLSTVWCGHFVIPMKCIKKIGRRFLHISIPQWSPKSVQHKLKKIANMTLNINIIICRCSNLVFMRKIYNHKCNLKDVILLLGFRNFRYSNRQAALHVFWNTVAKPPWQTFWNSVRPGFEFSNPSGSARCGWVVQDSYYCNLMMNKNIYIYWRRNLLWGKQ